MEYRDIDAARLASVTTQEQADDMVAALVADLMVQQPGLSLDKAKTNVRGSIAYFTGYMSDEQRARVERFFRCAHPIFGAIAANTPPSNAQSYSMGELAALREPGLVDDFARLSYLIPRVDAKRVHFYRHSGVLIRAVGVDGEIDNYDLMQLTRDSVLGWMRGKDSQTIERLVLMLLDHVSIEEEQP